jgi:hypothetical protein
VSGLKKKHVLNNVQKILPLAATLLSLDRLRFLCYARTEIRTTMDIAASGDEINRQQLEEICVME